MAVQLLLSPSSSEGKWRPLTPPLSLVGERWRRVRIQSKQAIECIGTNGAGRKPKEGRGGSGTPFSGGGETGGLPRREDRSFKLRTCKEERERCVTSKDFQDASFVSILQVEICCNASGVYGFSLEALLLCDSFVNGEPPNND